MAHYDLIIKNGLISTYSDFGFTSEQGNIGVSNKTIVTVTAHSQDTAELTIDAKGLSVLPGIIDSQVHFREPGLTHKEDIESGTRAAVMGGVTTVFEMPNTNPVTSTAELHNDKIVKAKSVAHCNYAFFIGGCVDNVEQLSTLENLDHCPGVKVFLGSSFGNLLVDNDSVFENIMKNGHKRVTIHSEDEARLKERKHIAIEAAHPKFHPVWRDEESALISTKKSIHYARKFGRPVHMLHISSAEEMFFLSQQKDIATVEILPQFLTLTAPDCYERWGTLAQQNPPIRDQRHLDYLWQAVNNGTVDIIGSDHAPHTLAEKNKPYPLSPSGMPGVQTLLPIMLTHVHNKKLSLQKFIQLTTENPRKTFNIKNKGRIAVGYDADFTLVDLQKSNVIAEHWLESKSNWSPFVGMQTMGWPIYTIVQGQIAMAHDQLVTKKSGRPVTF